MFGNFQFGESWFAQGGRTVSVLGRATFTGFRLLLTQHNATTRTSLPSGPDRKWYEQWLRQEERKRRRARAQRPRPEEQPVSISVRVRLAGFRLRLALRTPTVKAGARCLASRSDAFVYVGRLAARGGGRAVVRQCQAFIETRPLSSEGPARATRAGWFRQALSPPAAMGIENLSEEEMLLALLALES